MPKPPKYFLRDPICGYVALTEEQKKVIDLPVFQRLKRVKQLSLVDTTYPDGVHSRFSHSLGAMELARRAGEHLLKKEKINEEDKEALEWAALLHDVGHFPFSHVFEAPYAYHLKGEKNPGRAHQIHIEQSREIIRSNEFGIKEIIGEQMAEKVCKLIDPTSADSKEQMILKELITGWFSVDRLDYLRRDAYHCGTPEYGTIDVDRILLSITVEGDRIVWEEKAAYALEQAILSFFNMYRAVYYHRTVRASYLLFQRIIWEAFEKNIFNRDENFWKKSEEWNAFDDYRCLEKIREASKNYGESEEIKILINSLLSRKLPKQVSPDEIDDRIRMNLMNLCENAEDRVKNEKEILKKIQEKYSDCNMVFFDSIRLVPYPYPSIPEQEPLLLTKRNEYITLKRRAPYLPMLEHAWEHEKVRIYVGYKGVSRLETDKEFVKKLKELI